VAKSFAKKSEALAGVARSGEATRKHVTCGTLSSDISEVKNDLLTHMRTFRLMRGAL